MSVTSPVLLLGASMAAGLMIGVERGWRLRGEASGSRVAGVRTYSLLGTAGGVSAVLGQLIHPLVALALVAALSIGLVIGYWRGTSRRDATSFVTAIVALALGMLAGAGQPALAVACAAIVTLLLATREQSHGFVAHLNEEDVHAFARYAVIAAAVLPFLPNRSMGPLDAWNPFQLWLVVVLVTGFSFAGYIANRTVGARKGVLATALIGGAYSSTAVTAALSQQLGRGGTGPLAAGIILASAVMYLRVIALVAILSPSTLAQFAMTVGPAAVVGVFLAAVAWRLAPQVTDGKAKVAGNPIELLPALGFVVVVAAAAVLTRWAQGRFGEAGIATSLFVTGSFDVDAAVVTLSGLPVSAIGRDSAAIAIAGTVAANMMLKIVLITAYARRNGLVAISGLGVSTGILLLTIGWRLFG